MHQKSRIKSKPANCPREGLLPNVGITETGKDGS